MQFIKYNNTVNDIIKNNNGNVEIYAVDSNDKMTHLQKRSWSKYKNDNEYYDFTNPFSMKRIIYVIKK